MLKDGRGSNGCTSKGWTLTQRRCTQRHTQAAALSKANGTSTMLLPSAHRNTQWLRLLMQLKYHEVDDDTKLLCLLRAR